MRLLSLVSGICARMGRPVQYSNKLFSTVQDYRKSVGADIWIYDRVQKKRRRVTLRVPTTECDTRKTKVSICANFIHQHDAYIAMKMIEELRLIKAPVYTVHDNFITTPAHAPRLSDLYTKVFSKLNPPLRTINGFINLNLIAPINPNYMVCSDEISVDLNANCDDLSTASNVHWLNDPIPSAHLLFFLQAIPTTDAKKTQDEMVRAYELYVRTVCGGGPYHTVHEGGVKHLQLWNEFTTDIYGSLSGDTNYSLHA